MFIPISLKSRLLTAVLQALFLSCIFIPAGVFAQFETLTYETQSFQVVLEGLPTSSNCGVSTVVLTEEIQGANTVTQYYPEENDDIASSVENIRIAKLDQTYLIKVKITLRSSVSQGASWFFPSLNFLDSATFVTLESTTPQVYEGVIKFRPQYVTIDGNENILPLSFAITAGYYDSQRFENVNNRITVNIPMMVEGISRNVEPRGVTVMPQIPFMVLHDPPGDASFAEISNTFSTSQAFSQSFQIDNENRIFAKAKIGGGVPGFLSVYGSLEAGFTFGVNQTTLTETEFSVESTKTYNTSDGDILIGDDADVFIGSGPTIAYGVAKTLTYDASTCRPKVGKTLTLSPTGDKREFILTAEGIRKDITIQQQIVATTPSELVKKQAQAQIEAWNQVLQKNEANKSNVPEISSKIIDGGTLFSNSLTTSTTTTNSLDTKIIVGADVAAEVGAEVLGNEFSGGVEISIRTEFGESTTTSSTESRSVSYTLKDDDPSDRLNIKIGRDRMYGTPVFKLENGSRTSCPYEGAYQLDQPKLVSKINNIDGKNVVFSNVPRNASAEIPLGVCNNSDVDRTYYLQLASSSNVNGAILTVAGTALNNTDNGVAFTIPAGQCFTNGGSNPLLTVSPNPTVTSINNYNNIIVYLYPLCEVNVQGETGGILDEINISVNFTTNAAAVPCITVDGVTNDTNPPAFVSSQSDITVNVNPGACSELVYFPTPTAIDNCSGVTVTQIAGPGNGHNFFPGTTVVTFEARDAAGNTSQQSFNVTVIDNEAPTVVSAPQDMTLNNNPGFCGQFASFDPPTAADNCAVASITQIAGPASGETFFVGTTTVSFEIKDNSGNTTVSSFNVTVLDTEAPVLNFCPDDFSVVANPDNCSGAAFYTTPTAFDNCVAHLTQEEGLASGENFPLGTTTVTFAFTDNVQNTTRCSFNVTVIDQEAPVIENCPETINVTTSTDACSTEVDWLLPTAVDNCSNVNVTATSEPGATFEVGETLVTYNFADDAGNMNVCAFAVIVTAGDTAFCEGSVGIDDKFTQQQTFTVFPNPASENVQISFERPSISTTSISLFSLEGKRVLSQKDAIKAGQQEFTISVSELPAGIYYLRMQNQEGLMSRKIVVE